MSRGTKIKEIEEFPRRLKIFFWVILFLFLSGTFSFRIISEDNMEDSVYRTAQTLAFMFAEESTMPERFVEIFLAIIGVFLIWWVLWSIADMLLDRNLEKYLKTTIHLANIRNMNKHIIIVGGGRIGEGLAKILILKNKPYLIIESDHQVVTSLKKKKYTVLEGDALKEDILKEAKIEKANKIITTLPKTENNILITLTAKELNPKIEVHSRCENSSLVSKLKRAGANIVTVPEVVAVNKIAKDLGL
jgi:voltage-gated potassium channel